MKNWKTTLAGIVVMAVQMALNHWAEKPVITPETIPTHVAAIGLMASKDHDSAPGK